MSDAQTEKFESHGLLELFGHQKLAGRISEQTIGGCHFIRIDVPQVEDVPAYTRFFTQGAIYGMTPTSEAVAQRLAAGLRARPVSPYDLAPAPPAPMALTRGIVGFGPSDDDDGEDDEENPAPPAAQGAVEVGGTYTGTVTRILDFGALIALDGGAEGLLHISQITHLRPDNVRDFLAEGQVVTVKVIESDQKGRIKLSMKALLSPPSFEEADGILF